ncbi:GtrA family protein [Streptomyces sp. NPDC051940]|uniref:GtrA family protein n=1 Tax=Streptomyces sp. NPDC051940 TaxID=3155675 RepID=UPI003413C844
MRAQPAISARLTALARELVKFAMVGGAGIVVNFLVFNLVHLHMDVPVGRANVVSTSVAIGFNYLGFRHFAYRGRDSRGRRREMTLFMLFSLVGLVIETGTVYATTYWFHWDSPVEVNVFKFLGIAVASLFRFWSYRTWVFLALPESEPAGVAQERAAVR